MASNLQPKMDKNIIPHNFTITRSIREKNLKQRAQLIWFTGLSGSGKSTLANALELSLSQKKYATYILDGDNIRSGINNNLGFSKEDRKENIRRIAEIAHLFLDAGIIVLAAFVSPYKEDRQMVKDIVGNNHFNEVFVNTPIEICENRDTKGFYKKARAGKIDNFTGVNAPFEAPKKADLEIDTSQIEIQTAVAMLEKMILPKIEGRLDE